MHMHKEEPLHRFVIIDDDPVYRRVMCQYATREGMTIDSYESLVDMGFVSLLGRYDAAIVDYDLGSSTGLEIGEYLTALFGDIPMIMVSEHQRTPGEKGWPQSIKAFIQKSRGCSYVLDEARRHARSRGAAD